MVSAEHIESVVRSYLDLVANGTADEVAALFATDATVEDPVGGEVHIGRHAIQGFYKNIESAPKETELLTLRVAGHEAAFLFAITVGAETSTKGRWVKRDGAPVATALASYAVDWVLPEVSKFQKPAPEGAAKKK